MVSNLVFFKGKKLKTWNSRYKLSLISISPNNNKSFKHAFRINARIHAFAQLRLTWTLNNQKFRGERRISIRLVSSSKWAAALNYKTILVSTYFRSYLRIIHAEILVDPRKLCAVGLLFPERNNIIGPKHFQHLRTYFDAKVDATVPFATNTWKIICWDIENGLCERDSSLSIHLVGNFDTREIR